MANTTGFKNVTTPLVNLTLTKQGLIPRVPIYYDRRFNFTFDNAATYTTPLDQEDSIPNAYNIPRCSNLTWTTSTVDGDTDVLLFLMVVPIDSDLYPTRFVGGFSVGTGAHYVMDLPPGQRVLFGFFDAGGHYGGLTPNPCQSWDTDIVTDPTAPATVASNGQSSQCKAVTETPAPIRLILDPPSNPCHLVQLHIVGGEAPYTLTILNPSKATWADISVDASASVVLTNISDAGTTTIMYVIDKNLARSEITAEYKLGSTGTCNSTMDKLLSPQIAITRPVFVIRRQYHWKYVVPTTLIGALCGFLIGLAFWRWKFPSFDSDRRRDRKVSVPDGYFGRVTREARSELSVTITPSSTLPCHPSDNSFRSDMMVNQFGTSGGGGGGTFSTAIASAGSFDYRSQHAFDKLRQLPQIITKTRDKSLPSFQNSNCSQRGFGQQLEGNASIELVQISPQTGSANADSPNRSGGPLARTSLTQLGLIHDSSSHGLGGEDDSALTSTLADPNEFVYRNSGWRITNSTVLTSGTPAPAPPVQVAIPSIIPTAMTAAAMTTKRGATVNSYAVQPKARMERRGTSQLLISPILE